MQTNLYRYQHKFYDQKRLDAIQANYTLDDLRAMLKGKTWEDICKWSINSTFTEGVQFTARIGCFLRRNAIAVCALNQIVAMRFVENPTLKPNFAFQSVLTGAQDAGFVLLQGDFMNGRLGDIKLTDLVLGEGEG